MRLPRARALETLTMLLCLWGLGRFASEAWPDGETPISQFRPGPGIALHDIPTVSRHIESDDRPSTRIDPQAPRMSEAQHMSDATLSQPLWDEASTAPTQMPEAGPIGLLTPHFETRASDKPVLGSFWLLARTATGAPASAARGELGGSQMGARLRLPLLGQGLAAHLRASSSLNLSRDKEVALGLSWRPLRRVAAEIIIEQRLGLDAQGRSDPAILLAAGMNDTPIGSGLIAEGYGQIGMVGHPKLDAYGDGRLTLTTHIHPQTRLGGGIWAGAQPDASRVDIGPTLLVPAGYWRATLDWRIRVAGGARPASGPSITLGRNF
jgi:hypothetical protein